jgi:hypothetical protein
MTHEKLLIRRMIKGYEQAFERFFDAYFALVYRFTLPRHRKAEPLARRDRESRYRNRFATPPVAAEVLSAVYCLNDGQTPVQAFEPVLEMLNVRHARKRPRRGLPRTHPR